MKHPLFITLAVVALMTASCGKDTPEGPADLPKITFTTAKKPGEKIKLRISAEEADRPDVWIDLNGNNKKDAGEAVTKFYEETEYTLGARTITLHGKVTGFDSGFYTGNYDDRSFNKITALDVSKNTKLTILQCGHNNISTLAVKENTALVVLECYYNQLKELNVSKNTELKELYCYYNQLKELNVSENTERGMLYCYDNQLAVLDVSKNTKLTHLYCYDNQIKAAAMTALVNSLPDRKGKEAGEIYPIGGDNEWKAEHETIATGKNWEVQ